MNAARTMVASVAVALASPAPADTGRELHALRSLAAAHGEQLWPGFGSAAFGFLILEQDREILICRPTAPASFKPDGEDAATGCPRFVGPRGKLPANMLAAMPMFGPPWTIVMGPPPTQADKLPRWRSTVLHEHTHQWQSELPGYYDRVKALDLAGGDESGMWMLEFPFPYADPVVSARYADAAGALVAAVEARGTPAFPARLREYLAARRAFTAAAGERNWRYLDFQLWQEGVARWTEIALSRRSGDPATVADADRHEQKMLDMLRKPDLAEHQRVIVYAYGMAEALLMDACGLAWRSAYPQVLALGPLLDAAEARCEA
jgi:hypothetical protein